MITNKRRFELKATFLLVLCVVGSTLSAQVYMDINFAGMFSLNEAMDFKGQDVETVIRYRHYPDAEGKPGAHRTIKTIELNSENRKVRSVNEIYRNDTLSTEQIKEYHINSETGLVDTIVSIVNSIRRESESHTALTYGSNGHLRAADTYFIRPQPSQVWRHVYEVDEFGRPALHVRDNNVIEEATYLENGMEIVVTTDPGKTYAKSDTMFIEPDLALLQPIGKSRAYNMFGDLIYKRHRRGGITFYHYQYDEYYNWIRKERWSLDKYKNPRLTEVEEREIVYRAE